MDFEVFPLTHIDKYIHFSVDKVILSLNRPKQHYWLGRGDIIFLDLISWLKTKKLPPETNVMFCLCCHSVLVLKPLLVICFNFTV